MKIKGHELNLKKRFFKFLYYSFAIHLPRSSSKPLGKFSKGIRVYLCRHIFEYCGNNINVEKGAEFGNGFGIRLGDNSGLGVNSFVPDGSHIGNNVMMGPNCYVLAKNHKFADTSIPMINQGYLSSQILIIEDDVWIGRNVTILPGRKISTGSIIAACCVLTKDFPAYSIVGGNPSKLIRSRLSNE